jgi:hypothetical protein
LPHQFATEIDLKADPLTRAGASLPENLFTRGADDFHVESEVVCEHGEAGIEVVSANRRQRHLRRDEQTLPCRGGKLAVLGGAPERSIVALDTTDRRARITGDLGDTAELLWSPVVRAAVGRIQHTENVGTIDERSAERSADSFLIDESLHDGGAPGVVPIIPHAKRPALNGNATTDPLPKRQPPGGGHRRSA